MAKFIEKENKRIAFYLVAALAVAIYLLIESSQPYFGVTLKEASDGTYVVAKANPMGWAAKNGIEINDNITSIDDMPPNEISTVSNHLRLEGIKKIEVQKKNGESIQYIVHHSINLLEQYIYHMIFPAIYFLLNMVLSFVLLRNQINKKSALILIYLLLTLGISYISAGGSAKLSFVGGVSLRLTFLLIPELFLHFVYNYLVEHNQFVINKFYIKLSYGIGIVACGILFIDYFNLAEIPYDEKDIVLTTFLVLVTITVSSLVRANHLLRKNILKNSINWLLNSFLLASTPFLFLYMLPYFLLDETIISGELASLFVFFIPTIIFYLLLMDKLYTTKFYLTQLKYYSLLLFIPSILLTAIFKTYFWDSFSFITIIRYFLLSYVILFLFLVLKNFIDRSLRAKLFVEKEQYQESLYRFSETLKRKTNIADICKAVEREIKEVLQCQPVYCFKVGKRSNVICSVDNVDVEEFASLTEKIKKMYLFCGKVIQRGENFGLVIAERKEYFYIVFAQRQSILPLDRDQLDWLSTISYNASLAIDNFVKMEEVLKELSSLQHEKAENGRTEWINRLLFKISEKERGKLAIDIHDSILQDLILLKRKIEKIKLETDTLYTIKENLSDVEEDLLDIMYTTRETCNELSPTLLLEVGLEYSIQELASKFRLRSNSILEIQVINWNGKFVEHEYELVVYRVIQELLNNAIKHANAKLVHILIVMDDKEISINYSDDGIGFKSEKMINNVNKSIGLTALKGRINSVGGNMQLRTNSGEGVKMEISIPLKIRLGGA